MSDFENKKAVPAVLNSLTLAFSGQEIKPTPEIGPSPTPSPHENGKGEGDTLETLEGLFNAHIAGFKAKRNRLGTVMHVKLTIRDFEKSVRSAKLDGRGGVHKTPMSFSHTMVTLLRSAEKKKPYRVDIVYNLENDPTSLLRSSPDTFVRALKRVSAITSQLEQKGLPKKMMSAGLGKGKAGYVDLYFYRYKPMALPSEVIERLKPENNVDGQQNNIIEQEL